MRTGTMMAASEAGWVLEMPPRPRAGSGLLAHELTHTVQQRGGATQARDSRDRFANAQTSYLLQRNESNLAKGARPAASGRLKARQKMIGQQVDFVHFYVGKDDAKLLANDGHRATSHRRIHPVDFRIRLDRAQSLLVGVAMPGTAVGHRYPNLTLKRGTMTVQIRDAIVTFCGKTETAFSIPLENATVADLRIEQLNP